MNKAEAEELVQCLLGLGEPLNSATLIAKRLRDQGEKEALLRELGEVMTRVYTRLMLPIIQQYPDLDPDR